MPSAFAHAAIGGALSTWGPRGGPRWLPWCLPALSAAPDLDVIGFWWGIPYGHPLGHRGLTHSLPFAAAVAGAIYALLRGRPFAGRIAVLCGLAVASHGLLDTFTNAGLGVGLWIPFDAARHFAEWRPISTSPLSVRAFFSTTGLAIVTNEAFWVGLPATAIAVAGVSFRRRARRDGSA
ncbi:MAG: metal-dependent hydrolase [Myxococcota bacterium]